MQFFQELYSHIDKNLGEKFEDMFLVKIANKGTSLKAFKRPKCIDACIHSSADSYYVQ